MTQTIDEKIESLGLTLPEPLKLPPSVVVVFPMIRVHENIAYLSGHGPLNADGTIAQPLGKVGSELTVEQGYEAAKLTTLSMLTSLRDELGSLDRITAWLRVFGMVNSASGFKQQTPVINSCSEIIVDIFGSEIGAHARSAVGMAELPMGLPVEIEATVAFK